MDRRMKIGIAAGACILVIGVISWYAVTHAESVKAAAGMGKPGKEYTVRTDTIGETLTVSGEIDAREKATLRFQSSGLLTWVGVKTGDRVRPAQAIASLDTRDLKKRLEKYLLTYRKTRLDYEQTKDEYREPGYWGLTDTARAAIDRAFDNAQSDLTSSVLDVELQDIALKFATLTTPIGGIVTRVDTPNPGVNITPAAAEFDIVNPDTLYLSVIADQTEVVKLPASASAVVVLDAFPDKSVTGYVEEIAFTPKTGESGTVYEVKVKLPVDRFGPALRLGMTGDATFSVGRKTGALTVHPSAVRTDKDTRYVMKKTSGGPARQTVTVGIETDDAVEITSGLAPGDVVYD